jgi:hypothetical protein
MATITGSIKFSTDDAAQVTLTFEHQDPPIVIGSTVNLGGKVSCQTTSAGALPASFVLVEGRYTVTVSNGDVFEISVPTGAGPLDISALITDEALDGLTAYERAGNFRGSGTPEGVVTASPGAHYTDYDTGNVWAKRTGTGSTGWINLIS